MHEIKMSLKLSIYLSSSESAIFENKGTEPDHYTYQDRCHMTPSAPPPLPGSLKGYGRHFQPARFFFYFAQKKKKEGRKMEGGLDWSPFCRVRRVPGCLLLAAPQATSKCFARCPGTGAIVLFPGLAFYKFAVPCAVSPLEERSSRQAPRMAPRLKRSPGAAAAPAAPHATHVLRSSRKESSKTKAGQSHACLHD